MQPALQEIREYIDNRSTLMVFTHENPDGDTISCALALSLFLKRLGKKIYTLSKGPFNRTEIRSFENKFEKEPPILDSYEGIGAIVVDCSSLNRTGFTDLKLPSFKVIDHHSLTEEDSGSGFIDDQSPSTTLLVAQVIESYGLGYTEQEATHLLFGFCTDTDFFKHLQPQSAHYLLWVKVLMEAGASPRKVFDQMLGSFSLASRRYTGKLLDSCEDYFDGKLLLICEDPKIKAQYSKGAQLDRDPDAMYRLLLSVEGVEVVGILKESEKGITVGLRSKNKVNVAEIAHYFGGGGHIMASGFSVQGSLLDVKKQLIDQLKTVIYL